MKFMQALLQSLSTLAFISSSLGYWKCTDLLCPGRDGEGWPWTKWTGIEQMQAQKQQSRVHQDDSDCTPTGCSVLPGALLPNLTPILRNCARFRNGETKDSGSRYDLIKSMVSWKLTALNRSSI